MLSKWFPNPPHMQGGTLQQSGPELLGLRISPEALAASMQGNMYRFFTKEERRVLLLRGARKQCTASGIAYIVGPAAGAVVAVVKVLEGCAVMAKGNDTSKFYRAAMVSTGGWLGGDGHVPAACTAPANSRYISLPPQPPLLFFDCRCSGCCSPLSSCQMTAQLDRWCWCPPAVRP